MFRASGRRPFVDSFGSARRFGDTGQLHGHSGVLEDPRTCRRIAEDPCFVFMQHEVGVEPRMADRRFQRLLDMCDTRVRVSRRAGTHAGEVVRQGVIIENRRDSGSPRVEEEPPDVADHLLAARHTAAEGATRLDALRL